MHHRTTISATAVAIKMAVATKTAAAVLMTFAAATATADEMKYPDMETQWRNPLAAGFGNPWGTTKPMGLGQEAPLDPEYQAIFEKSVKEQAAGGQGNSLGLTCIHPGMPKVMNFSEPGEIMIRPGTTYIVPQRYPVRRIYTDGRDFPIDEAPTFTGYSIGKWLDEDGDGRYDVLEVETRNFKGPRVFESTGIPLHKDNQTIVKERIYLDKDDPDTLHDIITTIDHALTRPWTVDRIYKREQEPKWKERSCHEANLHVVIGSDQYFLSADQKLMPVKAGQAPPDLRYFKQSSK
jgi:hypothetical protein